MSIHLEKEYYLLNAIVTELEKVDKKTRVASFSWRWALESCVDSFDDLVVRVNQAQNTALKSKVVQLGVCIDQLAPWSRRNFCCKVTSFCLSGIAFGISMGGLLMKDKT